MQLYAVVVVNPEDNEAVDQGCDGVSWSDFSITKR